MSQAQPPTQSELDAYIRTRLALAGVDLDLLPEQPEPETGVPTREQALNALRAFVARAPAAIAGWSPPAEGTPAAIYAQQASPPLLYPSITEAWTGKGDEK